MLFLNQSSLHKNFNFNICIYLYIWISIYINIKIYNHSNCLYADFTQILRKFYANPDILILRNTILTNFDYTKGLKMTTLFYYYPLQDVLCNDDYYVYGDNWQRDFNIGVFYHAGQLLDSRTVKISQLRKDFSNIKFEKFIPNIHNAREIEFIQDKQGFTYKHLKGIN